MMRRDPGALAGREFDLLVVGGGIHGACIARDAALRGLSTALVDAGDFGGATSHNSLKLIHGGLRYLQHGDLPRIRQSVRERRAWFRIAPHLCRPLRFVMPTYGHGLRGREALWCALKAYDLAAFDRNRGVGPDHRIPRGRALSKDEVRALIPGVPEDRLTGGAEWHDGQMIEADRIVLECVLSAHDAGAVVANYVRAEALSLEGARVTGVAARDVLADEAFAIRAKVTVNTAGPWTNALLATAGGALRPGALTGLAKGINVVTRRLLGDYAAGVTSTRASDSLVASGGRLYFITPWKDRSIVGTFHLPYDGAPDAYRPSEADLEAFLEEINAAYPPAELRREDVDYVYAGLTPAREGRRRGEARRARHNEILDHAARDRVAGIVTLIGVKYTTARGVAETVTDLACRRLGRGAPCRTADLPLPGAAGPGATDERLPAYGTRAGDVLKQGGAGGDLLAACWRHAVREEMAVRLGDLLFRRTNAAEEGAVPAADVERCARLMAEELGWSEARREAETDEAAAGLAAHRGRGAFATAGSRRDTTR